MTIKGTQTEKNLLKSFAGESQARSRYEMYAKVAKKEGYEQIAAYFTETAHNESSHAKQFFRFLEDGDVEITASYPTKQIGTTAENLKAAAHGENEEHTLLYPSFAKTAEEEGFKNIAIAYRLISKVEEHHEQRFLKLLKNIQNNKVFNRDEKVEWKCWVCGHIHVGNNALEVCPVCQHPKAYFAINESNF